MSQNSVMLVISLEINGEAVILKQNSNTECLKYNLKTAPAAPARGPTGDYKRGGKVGNAFEGDIGTLAPLSFTSVLI